MGQPVCLNCEQLDFAMVVRPSYPLDFRCAKSLQVWQQSCSIQGTCEFGTVRWGTAQYVRRNLRSSAYPGGVAPLQVAYEGGAQAPPFVFAAHARSHSLRLLIHKKGLVIVVLACVMTAFFAFFRVADIPS